LDNTKLLASKNNHCSWAQWLHSSEYDDIEDDYLLDVILTRLRTKEGLDLDWIEVNVGSEQVKNILRGAELGLELNLAERKQSFLRLKDPEGFLFSNSIISSIFSELT
jgi:oxygen-independent coproporphyrinogen-3 oxidase